MTIFRVEHNKNYTTINNTITRDKSLSWKAKGIWLYAFSRRDDWEFYMNDLINQSTDGRDSVREGLKELENAGYLLRAQKRENGKFGDADWFFYEVPQEKLKKCLPKTDFPTTVSPTTESHPLVSTENKVSTEKEQQQQDAVVFSDLLQDFSKEEQAEMLTAIERHNIPEERIRLAVDHIKQSTETIKSNVKFFVWHCREKIPPKICNKESDPIKQIALNYNDQLAKIEKFKKVFEQNKTFIEQGKMFIFENGGFQQVSLKSQEFQNDIIKSKKQLGEIK